MNTLLIDLIWQRSLSSLENEMDPQIFSAYIKPLRLSAFDEDKLEVSFAAPSKFICAQVGDKFKEKISNVIASQLNSEESGLNKNILLGTPVQLKFFVDDTIIAPAKSQNHALNLNADNEATGPRRVVLKKFPKPTKLAIKPAQGRAFNFSTGINARYTFSNFVVGSSNEFCHAASMRVAESPGQSYNPLFIYGGVGLGKTHLLHAIGNAVLGKNPQAHVLYMSSEQFTNELILALRQGKMDQFKNQLRGAEVLLIDDIQFMCGKERTQEEFFHTFNALYNAKRQIVITSDKVPQDIPGLEERLQTRFSWGLTADTQAPDFETRVAILKKKAQLDSVLFPEDVAHYVAEHISSNVRELEGALTRLHALSSLRNIPMTIELAELSLKPFLQLKNVRVSIEQIKKVVAEWYDIKVHEMISKRRTKSLSLPRQVAMYFCRKHTTFSYPEIGAQFGNRDHSSVVHAANVVAGKIKKDADFKVTITDIEKLLLLPL